MHRGFTKRWRKRWSTGCHKDLLLWVLMDYFIDHANWEDKKVPIHGQMVHVRRGQHLFGTNSLASFLGVGRQQIRARLVLLEESGFLTIKPTNKYSIATICNYDLYQLESGKAQPSNQPTNNQQITTPKELKNKKTPGEISSLRKKYPDQNLIDQAFRAIASTRKSNRVADSVLLAQLKKWESYPIAQVEAGIRTYLEKGYAGQGKREGYLLGIIRNGSVQATHHQQHRIDKVEVFNGLE